MQSPTITSPSLVVASNTHEGLMRDHNEDALRIASLDAVPPALLAGRGVLMVVCDGVGGQQAGEVASAIAVRAAFDAYYNDVNANRAESLRLAALAAHEAIRGAQAESPGRAGMASTIVMAAIFNGQVCVANVGDSRCYLWRAGQLVRLSTDHSWVNAQVQAGILQPEQARVSDHHNVLTRILGSTSVSCEAATVCQSWQPGDKLLLCSDGLWNMVPDADIARMLEKAGADARFAAESLVRAANEAGGADNITCVVAIDPSQPTALVRIRRHKTALWLGMGAAAAVALIALLLIVQMGFSNATAGTATAPATSLVAADATATPLPTITPAGAIANTELTPTVTPVAANATATPLPTITPAGAEPTPTALPVTTEVTNTPLPTNTPAGATDSTPPLGGGTPTPIAIDMVQGSPMPAATATVQMGVIRFCRTPNKNNVCLDDAVNFNKRRDDVFGVWNIGDLAGASVIEIQWAVNGASRTLKTCTISKDKCQERNVSPTQSSIQTNVSGEYRLDVLAEGKKLLTGTFTVK